MKKCFIIISILISLISCNETSDKDNNLINDSSTKEIKEIKAREIGEKTKKVFYTVPSPVETINLFRKLGVNYDHSILNPPENVKKYVTVNQKALALGIYGADLSYICLFNQSQETMFYLSCVKKISEELGITNALNDKEIERFEANIGNRDTLLKIVSDTYWKVDKYLKNNNMEGLSAIVVASGWIEGLYLSTKVAENADNNELILKKIAIQKLSLNNLIEILNYTQKTNETIRKILSYLEEIKKSFENVKVSPHYKEAETNASIKTTIIHGTTTININNEDFKKIKNSVSSIRNNIVLNQLF